MRETREFRDLVTNFTRENRERKFCGCHCVKERVSSGRVRKIREGLGRLTTMISTGALRDGAFRGFGDGAVGDFGDGMVEVFGEGDVRDFGECIRDDGSSNSVGDSEKMEQLGEEGDGFLHVVLITDENESRNDWSMGIITRVEPDSKDFVRSAVVKTQTSELRRSVHKLVLLHAAEDGLDVADDNKDADKP